MTRFWTRAALTLCALSLLAAACSVEVDDPDDDSDDTTEESDDSIDTSGDGSDDTGGDNESDSADDAGRPGQAQRFEQLADQVVPMSTQMMCSGYDDLEPIGQAFDQVRLVGLGEATHGTQDFNRVRNRLFEYMATEKGYRYLVLEEEMGAMIALDRYLAFGEGDLPSAVSRIKDFYQTDDYVALFSWMRLWNEQHPDDLIRVYGNDAQWWSESVSFLDSQLTDAESQEALARIRAVGEEVDLLAGFDPEQPAAELFTERGLDSEEAVAAQSKEFRAEITSNVETLSGRLPDGLDARDRGFLELVLGNLGQYAETLDLRVSWYGANGEDEKIGDLVAEEGDPRERALAANVLGAMALEGDSRKGVYYAHNEHIGREDFGLGSPASGDMITDAIGDDYMPVFTDFYDGTLKGFDPIVGAEVSHRSGPIPDDSLAAVMEQFDAEQLWLSFDSLPADDPDLAWLFEQPLNQWRFGGFIFPIDDPNLSPLGSAVLPDRFDAVIHVRNPEHIRYEPAVLEVTAAEYQVTVEQLAEPEFIGETISLDGCEL